MLKIFSKKLPILILNEYSSSLANFMIKKMQIRKWRNAALGEPTVWPAVYGHMIHVDVTVLFRQPIQALHLVFNLNGALENITDNINKY